MITQQTIKNGTAAGIIKLIPNPVTNQGTVCQIGDNHIWFGGETAETENPEEYQNHMDENEIQEDIFSTLESIRIHDPKEYQGIEEYLNSHLRKPKEMLLFVNTVPNALYEIFTKSEMNRILLDPKSRLQPDIAQRIREAAVIVPEESINDSCRKYKDKLFYWNIPGNPAWFCGWGGRRIGSIMLEQIRENALWTVKKTEAGEEILYFNEPDENGYLSPARKENA